MVSPTLTNALAPVDPGAVEQARPLGPVGLLNSPAMLEQITESLPAGMDARRLFVSFPLPQGC